MIFGHFSSCLTKLLPNYVFIDCIVHKNFSNSEKRYKIVIVKSYGLFLFSSFYLLT